MLERPDRKRLLGRPRSRWLDYINVDPQEAGRGGIN
jgi:hypothetical protein